MRGAKDMAFEEVEKEVDSNETREAHPFDRLMFGPMTHSTRSERKQADPENSSSNQLNFEELMTQIDTLMTSAKELKPMFAKIRPFFDQFLKK